MKDITVVYAASGKKINKRLDFKSETGGEAMAKEDVKSIKQAIEKIIEDVYYL